MRIGIDGRFIQDHFPGIGRYTYNLARELPVLDPSTEYLLYVDPAQPNSRYDLSTLDSPNLSILPVTAPVFSPRTQAIVPKRLLTDKLDLFHSPYYVMPYVLPCPAVVTIYDLNSSRNPESLPSRLSRLMFKATTWMATRVSRAIVTISFFAKHDLMQFYRVPPEKITVTYLAAESHYRTGLLSPSRVADLAQKYGLPPRYVLYLGMNKPLKNLVRLVEAWALLVERCHWNTTDNRPQLVLAGRHDDRYPEVRQRVSDLELQQHVRFVGAIDEEDQPCLYAGAEAFVFPSLLEGFGLPVVEAMACGVPVVCSNTSSLPEVVGDAAVTFDPLNVEAIADALNLVLMDEDLRQALAQRGIMRAQSFSWQRLAAQTLRVYQTAVRA